MAFTRHIDPIESMKIGRRENSFEVVGVQFSIDGSPVQLKTPELIFNFLKRIERIEFPDNLYRPHNIILLKKEEVEDTMDAFIQAMKANTSPVNPQAILSKINAPPKMKTEIKETRLKFFYGKTIIFAGQFILIPSEKEIEEKAPWLIEDERLEEERIINESLRHREMEISMIRMLKNEADSEAEKQRLKFEYEKTKQEIIKRSIFNIKPRDFTALVHDSII
jgi:hypothetical protein